MQKATVLCVDDDTDLLTVVRSYLEDDGYKVLTAANAQDLDSVLGSSAFDVVLLDLMLPDSEGFGLMTKIKATSPAPIIIVSGKTETTEKIVGLELGADDYLTKPFEMRELSARIKAVLRRSQASQVTSQNNAQDGKPEIIEFTNWKLDRTQYQLFSNNGESADLTTGEFKLLEALVLSPNRALSREYLFDLTRSEGYESYDRAIDIQIARIRKKLKKDPNSGSLIKTVRGVGYMFTADAKP